MLKNTLLQVAAGNSVLSPEVTARVFDAVRRVQAGREQELLSEREVEVLRCMAKGLTTGMGLDAPVASVMTTDVVYADAGTRLFEVVRQFKERQIGRLIVVDGGVPVGILTQSDVIGLFPSL